MSFRVGRFNRQEVRWPWRGFCPDEAVNSIIEIDPAALYERGKKLILIDVDNTLLPWRSEDIPDSTIEWIKTARELGFQICILSNTRHRARLKRLAERMGIDYLLGRFKPSRRMYVMALERYGMKPEQAIMIGDQLMTDVLGANRSGIEAIWVKQMTSRDLVTTKFNRALERMMRGVFYRTLPVETVLEDKVAAAAGTSLLHRPIVRQFAKFAIVGGTSTVIDLGLHRYLMFNAPYGDGLLRDAFGSWLRENLSFLFGGATPYDASFPMFKILTSGIAMFNSFIWNRRWTFKIKGKEDRHKQLVKFFAVSIAGVGLNVLIASSLSTIIPGHPTRSWAIASAVATIAVAFWNFSGQKLWAFRKKTP